MTGKTLGHYQVVDKLGQGGMGEVYRATDTKLGREVALKVLPEAFARDPERLARFEREARVLALLNHPNIAAIYGFERVDGVPFLVLEYVPGETLRGPLPIGEAVRVAGQIAEAFEAAHEKGIVHRDLKPANVKVTPEGKVKVLDFGLAKAFADEPQGDAAHSPTVSVLATRAGVILGTAAYMSPEQTRGKPLDKRTDIWSFGCVLYEILAGRPVFAGETIPHILVAIMQSEPDWSALPAATPAAVRQLLRRCLQKDPARRLRDITDARFEMEETERQPAEPERRAEVRRGLKPAALGGWAVAASLVAAALAFVHFREQPPAVPQAVRFTIHAPEKANLGIRLAVSPDGRRVAFHATGPDGRPQIWVRSLDSLEARALPGTDNPGNAVFWSPDSRFIGFWSAGKLKKIDVSGGPAQSLCDVAVPVIGATWNRQGVIVFSLAAGSGLTRVSAVGGIPTTLTTIDASRQETNHTWPYFLPDGRHFLYHAASTRPEHRGIHLASLEAPNDRKRLVDSHAGAVYAPSAEPGKGHLLFLREGTLMAQAFDTQRLDLAGEPIPVAEQVGSVATYGYFSASANGVLVYKGGGGAATQLVWFDREGKSLGPAGPPAVHDEVSLSPDGRRAAGNRRDPQTGNADIWLLELARGTSTRFTFHAAADTAPIWSPDGARIVFASDRGGLSNLYQKASSGAGNEELLLQSGEPKTPLDWSRDGRYIIFSSIGAKTKSDLWVLPLEGERKPRPFLQTEFQESHGQFSPDGRWIAYTSEESGRPEIYVQPFPDPGGKRMVSSGGGYWPRWRGDGKELFYMSEYRKLMAVDIKTVPQFEAGIPRALFDEARIFGFTAARGPRYAVSADGKRFLMNTLAEETTAGPITVVMNWAAGLR